MCDQICPQQTPSCALHCNLTNKIVNPETTRISSRRQVVIERIRRQFHLEPGEEFVVVAKGDVVVFKQLAAPSWDQFDELIHAARRQARAIGLTGGHVKQAIARTSQETMSIVLDTNVFVSGISFPVLRTASSARGATGASKLSNLQRFFLSMSTL